MQPATWIAGKLWIYFEKTLNNEFSILHVVSIPHAELACYSHPSLRFSPACTVSVPDRSPLPLPVCPSWLSLLQPSIAIAAFDFVPSRSRPLQISFTSKFYCFTAFHCYCIKYFQPSITSFNCFYCIFLYCFPYLSFIYTHTKRNNYEIIFY